MLVIVHACVEDATSKRNDKERSSGLQAVEGIREKWQLCRWPEWLGTVILVPFILTLATQASTKLFATTTANW